MEPAITDAAIDEMLRGKRRVAIVPGTWHAMAVVMLTQVALTALVAATAFQFGQRVASTWQVVCLAGVAFGSVALSMLAFCMAQGFGRAELLFRGLSAVGLACAGLAFAASVISPDASALKLPSALAALLFGLVLGLSNSAGFRTYATFRRRLRAGRLRMAGSTRR